MAGVETYILTIENDTEKSKITSVKKGTDVLKLPDGGIDLADVNASDQLNSAINPTQQTEAAEEQNNGLSQAPQQGTALVTNVTQSPAEQAEEAAKPNLLDTRLTGKYKKYTLQDLLNRLNDAKPGDHFDSRKNLATYINNNLDNWTNKTPKEITIEITKFADDKIKFKKDQKGRDTVILGGTHHTRKRTHKPRNAKSNTRKGHIYRTNRRRTHGKSSAHGKKQTRRNVNH